MVTAAFTIFGRIDAIFIEPASREPPAEASGAGLKVAIDFLCSATYYYGIAQ